MLNDLTGESDHVLRSEGLRVALMPNRLSRANAHSARVIKTVRREPLGWLLSFGERLLRRVLRQYID